MGCTASRLTTKQRSFKIKFDPYSVLHLSIDSNSDMMFQNLESDKGSHIQGP